MTEERLTILEAGAEDFAIRFYSVMKELAEE